MDMAGCIEMREPDGSWSQWSYHRQLPRDYLLFGVLARVRTDVEAAVPLRGLPDDAHPQTRSSLGSGGGPSASWLTTGELRAAFRRYGEQAGEGAEVGACMASVLAAMQALGAGGHKARFVFWFI